MRDIGGEVLITADHGNAETMLDPRDAAAAHGAYDESRAAALCRTQRRHRAERRAVGHRTHAAADDGIAPAARDDREAAHPLSVSTAWNCGARFASSTSGHVANSMRPQDTSESHRALNRPERRKSQRWRVYTLKYGVKARPFDPLLLVQSSVASQARVRTRGRSSACSANGGKSVW